MYRRLGLGISFGIALILLGVLSVSTEAMQPSPEAREVNDPPTLEQRMSWVRSTSDPGVVRLRLELATLVDEEVHSGKSNRHGIRGIAVSAAGLLVVIPSDDASDSAKSRVEEALAHVIVSRPELTDFGEITFEVRSLDVVPTATPSGWEAQLYGAGAGSGCSIAGSTYTDYLGIRFWFWLTAGHCSGFSPVRSAPDAGPYSWSSGSATGASDSGLYAIGTGVGPAPRARVLTDVLTTKNIAAQSDRPNFDVPGASWVCGVGRTSGTGCGYLTQIWVTPVNGIYYLREAGRSPACIPGDSGGAYFGRYLNQTVSLMGVIHGTSPGKCFYSDLELALIDRSTNLYRF